MVESIAPFYQSTNESLEGMMQGMDQRYGNILAIAGSGDQPFAMLETSAKVIAIDNSAEQIKLVKLRKKALEDEDFEGFLNPNQIGEIKIIQGESEFWVTRNKPEAISLRNKYFSAKPREGPISRMEMIRKNIDNLQIVEGDIFDYPGNGKFNAIYLSNVLDYYIKQDIKGEGLIPKIAEKLFMSRHGVGGIVYLSDLSWWNPDMDYCPSIYVNWDIPQLCPDLMYDRTLSEYARRAGQVGAEVYRKITDEWKGWKSTSQIKEERKRREANL